MGRRPTVEAIQFTKAELQMIDKLLTPLFDEWYNGYRSQTRLLLASDTRAKIRAALRTGRARSEESDNG